MNIIALIIEIQLITASGALAPGPLSISTIAIGNRSGWRGGLGVAIGHTIFEFPLYLLIGYGLINISLMSGIQWTLSILGGLALLYFTISIFKSKEISEDIDVFGGKSALLTGITLTGLNPYFIIWWLTVGAKLILDIVSTVGIGLMPVFYVFHVWMDYFWLALLAFLGYSALRKLTGKPFKIFRYALGLLMLYFSAYFILDGLYHFLHQA